MQGGGRTSEPVWLQPNGFCLFWRGRALLCLHILLIILHSSHLNPLVFYMPLSFNPRAALWLSLLLLGCDKKKEPQPTPLPKVTSLTLASLTPAAGATVSRASTITAQLNYSLADDETSSYGYRVAIQFATATSTSTFATNPSTLELKERKDTVTLQYPLSLIWDRTNPAPLRPIKCYYYLQRVNASGSTVIAQTAAQTFTE